MGKRAGKTAAILGAARTFEFALATRAEGPCQHDEDAYGRQLGGEPSRNGAVSRWNVPSGRCLSGHGEGYEPATTPKTAQLFPGPVPVSDQLPATIDESPTEPNPKAMKLRALLLSAALFTSV